MTVSVHSPSQSFCFERGRKQNRATLAVAPYIPSRGFFFPGSAFIDRNIDRFQNRLISVVGQNIVLLMSNDSAKR